MGRNIPNKSRKRKHPIHNRASFAQRIRRQKELLEKKESSKEILQNNNKALESSNDLPIISDVYETDRFVGGELPLSVQPFESNEIDLGTDTVIIKSELCEENNLHNEIDKPETGNAPETLCQLHQNDNEIPYSSGYLHEEEPEISYNKENELLLKVLKYLDECIKVDKFDLGGKLYAAKLKSVTSENQQVLANYLCRQVLLEAEHFKLDDQFFLTKFQTSDDLINYNVATDVSIKNDFEESGFIHLEKKTLLQNIKNRLTQNIRQNQFDNFAKFYATKMRSFSSKQYYYAEKLISKILLEAELGRLRANCKHVKQGNAAPKTVVSGKYARKYDASVLPASNVAFANNETQLTQSTKQFMHSSSKPSSSSRRSTQKKLGRPKKKKVPHTTKQLINNSVNKGLNNSLSKTPSIKRVTTLQNNVQKFSESSAQIQTRTGKSVNDQITYDSGNATNSSFHPPAVPLTSAISIPNIVRQLPVNTLIKVVFLKQGQHIT